MALAQEPQFVLLQAGNINFANPVFIYEHDNMHLARPIEKAANANDRNFKNGKRGRQVSISPPNRLPNDGSPTPDKKQSLRKKIRRIEIYEDDLANGKALGSTQVEMIKKKEDIRNRLEALKENGSGVMDKEYGNEAHLNDHLYRPSFSSGGCGQLNIHSGPLKVTTFNEFTQKLIECCEEEKIAIDNSMEARATALHKYELQVANYRELMKMALRYVDTLLLISNLTISQGRGHLV
jgi:hypothetical protein